MNPREPTAEQATAYFRDMAKGKYVPIALEHSKGLGGVHTPSIYHVTTPTDQTLARAREAVEKQKVIRGPEDERPIKKVKRGPVKKTKKPRSNEYSMPGLE